MNNFENKKVSIPLAIGIFLIPLIFAWFTLRKGYSKTARMISFGWLILGFAAFALMPVPPNQTIESKKTDKTNTAAIVDKSEGNQPPFELTDDPKQNAANAQAHYDKLADEDRPHFEVPEVDYTSPVAKVDLNNDKEIIASVGLPVVEKESGANQNGEPMTTYYFSDDLRNGLEMSLSREFVDVAWKYDQDKPEKASAVFEDGQRITRALLGGEAGAALYEKISKGGNAESFVMKDGTEVKNARCGQSMCRYQVVR